MTAPPSPVQPTAEYAVGWADTNLPVSRHTEPHQGRAGAQAELDARALVWPDVDLTVIVRKVSPWTRA